MTEVAKINPEVIRSLSKNSQIKKEGEQYIFWKFVDEKMMSPYYRGRGCIKYAVNTEVWLEDERVDHNIQISCGMGLHVLASLPPKQIRRSWGTPRVLIEVRVWPKDILSLLQEPSWWGIYSYLDGPKIRVRRLEVVAAYRVDKMSGNLIHIKTAPDYEQVPWDKGIGEK